MKMKGQSAMEYLQTYAWAILVVLVVGIALWQMGVLSPGGKGINRATGFAKIKVLDPSVRYYAERDIKNNSLNFSIINGAGDFIDINSIGISGDCINAHYPLSYLDPGATMIVGGWNCSKLHSGQEFYVDVNISYSIKLGKQRIEHFDYGTLQGSAN